jgi:hypothetical protein
MRCRIPLKRPRVSNLFRPPLRADLNNLFRGNITWSRWNEFSFKIWDLLHHRLFDNTTEVDAMHVLLDNELEIGLYPRVDNRPDWIDIIVVDWIWHLSNELDPKFRQKDCCLVT